MASADEARSVMIPNGNANNLADAPLAPPPHPAAASPNLDEPDNAMVEKIELEKLA